jgi:HEAT repeat protein
LKVLLQDKDLEVSAEASVGIAKLNDATASEILVTKLRDAQKEDNENASKRYMDALKNGLGGAGLVYALEVVPQDTPNSEERGRYVLEQLRELADPSAAKRYKEYIEKKTNPAHYRAQVALALADIGDPDAVPYLADRMDAKGTGFKCDAEPSDKCLSNNLGWKKQPPVDADPVTFREQQFSAQDIGDLAVLYPDKAPEFLKVAEPHLKKFNGWFPAPWLVASRALALLGDKETLDWAKKTIKDFKLPDPDLVNLANDPKCPKDKPSCTIFFLNELATATRYVGRAHDATFVDALTKMLERPKTKKGQPIGFSDLELENITNPGFRQAYMQSAQGAVDGLAEWGPEANKAVKDLIKTIRDKDQGSWTRLMAGRALGRVGSEADVLGALKEIKGVADPDAKVAVLMGAQQRPNAEIGAAALDMVAASPDTSQGAINVWASRVVGWAGTAGVEDRLLKMLDEKDLRPYAVLAIALGGDDDLVRRGMVIFEQKARAENRWEAELRLVQSLYLDTFDSRGLTMDDFDKGRLFRFVRNAETMRRAGASDDATEAGRSTHEWASIYLMAGFQRLDMNATVPGGIDRLILRTKLNAAAKSGDDEAKRAAVGTLKFLKEQGSIMALREEAGLTGELARRAFFELRNPAASGVPEKEKKEGEKDDPYFSKPKK